MWILRAILLLNLTPCRASGCGTDAENSHLEKHKDSGSTCSQWGDEEQATALLQINQHTSVTDLQDSPAYSPALHPTAGMLSHLETGRQVKRQQPEGELSWNTKVAFVLSAGALQFGISLYIKRLIANYEKEAQLSTPPWFHDTGMVAKIGCITLLSWFALGIGAFNQVILFNGSAVDAPHHLTIIEAVYLSVQIVTTVGYGDLTPARPEGQVFMALHILMGITLVAIVLGALIDVAVRRQQDQISDAVEEMEESTSTMLSMWSRHPVARAVGLFFLSVTAGTVFFAFFPGEDKTVWQSFYMSCVTLTTVGFGGFHPQTQGGYLFSAFWMLFGAYSSAKMVCTIGESMMAQRREFKSAAMQEDLLKEMDADGNGKVDKTEFLKYELVRRGACDKAEIDSILHLFAEIDTDNSGEIDAEDLKQLKINPMGSKTLCLARGFRPGM